MRLILPLALLALAAPAGAQPALTPAETLTVQCLERFDRMDNHLANAVEAATDPARRARMEKDYDLLTKLSAEAYKTRPKSDQTPADQQRLQLILAAGAADKALGPAEAKARRGDAEPLKALVRQCDTGLKFRILGPTWGQW